MSTSKTTPSKTKNATAIFKNQLYAYKDRVESLLENNPNINVERFLAMALNAVKRDKKLLSKPGYYKLLYIWSAFNKIIEKDGKKFFKDRYIKIKNEELYYNSENIIKSIYDKASLSCDKSVIFWAKRNLQSPREILFKNDTRWADAFSEIGIDSKYLV